MRHSVHQIEKSSYNHVAAIVQQSRGDNENFGTTRLADELSIALHNHDVIAFPSGTTLAFYGSRALLLATLRSEDHALAIGHDLSAELYSHGEPSNEELMSKSDEFVKWMRASWDMPA